MALSAAWFETGQDPAEGDTLRWLELLPPPQITASVAAQRRGPDKGDPVISYVPVNDTIRGKKIPDNRDIVKLRNAGLALLPEHRPRQPRRFPVAIPRNPVVHLRWDTDVPDDFREPLTCLCRKVVSIGHSASFVQMWLTDDPPAPTLVPSEGVAQHRLRVTGPGKIEYLSVRCNRDAVIRYRDAAWTVSTLTTRRKAIDQSRKAAVKGLKGKARKAAEVPYKSELAMIDQSIADNRAVIDGFKGRIPASRRPEPALWQGYKSPSAPTQSVMPKSFFDDALIVMSLSGKHLYPPTTLKLTETLRAALMSAIPEPIPEWISGHRQDRSPSLDPHLAFLPLPFVDARHADGRLMGIAMALPRTVEAETVGRFFEPWLRDDTGQPRPIPLFDGRWLECRMTLETRERPPWNLQSRTWTRQSRAWASVTPVVLDRHFSGKDKWAKAAEVMKDACTRIGLPRPETLLLHPVSRVRGVPHAREFPPIRRKSDRGRMHHCHVFVRFPEPVIGPVMIGAGRFRGYGFCRPMDPKGDRS